MTERHQPGPTPQIAARVARLHRARTALRPAHFLLNMHYRYSRKKYTPAIIQMINNPQIIEEVRPLTSKIPMLKRIAPIVRTRSFFAAIKIHQQYLFLITPLSALSLFNYEDSIKNPIVPGIKTLLNSFAPTPC